MPHRIDVHVGSRVRLLRMQRGITQEKLADKLGLTFQQVQKYEKGTNRVSASRLFEIADFLGAPISFFFDGGPDALPGDPAQNAIPSLQNVLSTRDGVRLIEAFDKIDSQETRRRIVLLLEQIAETGAGA